MTTPEIYALGTLTTGVSALVIGLAFALMAGWKRLRAARAARGGRGLSPVKPPPLP